jgi:hypothetical protein
VFGDGTWCKEDLGVAFLMHLAVCCMPENALRTNAESTLFFSRFVLFVFLLLLMKIRCDPLLRGFNILVCANGVINDPYVFAHVHLSSQVNASAAVDCHAFMMIC